MTSFLLCVIVVLLVVQVNANPAARAELNALPWELFQIAKGLLLLALVGAVLVLLALAIWLYGWSAVGVIVACSAVWGWVQDWREKRVERRRNAEALVLARAAWAAEDAAQAAREAEEAAAPLAGRYEWD